MILPYSVFPCCFWFASHLAPGLFRRCAHRASIRFARFDTNKEETTVLKEFKEFVMKGNVLDLAVAVIIGAAFGAIVTSLVGDVIMPPIGLVLGKVDFKDLFFPLN